jgi:hypothetical protein
LHGSLAGCEQELRSQDQLNCCREPVPRVPVRLCILIPEPARGVNHSPTTQAGVGAAVIPTPDPSNRTRNGID